MNTSSVRHSLSQPNVHHYTFKNFASRFEYCRSRSSQSDLTSITSDSSVDDDSCSQSELIMTTELGTEVVVAHHETTTLHELAVHEFSMKRYDEALDCWAQALGHNDEILQPIILWNLVKLHLEMGPNAEEHRRAAQFHFDNLRPHLGSIPLDNPTPNVLEFLVEKKEWDASVQIAKELDVSNEVLARIHFEQGVSTEESTEETTESLEMALSFEPSGKLRRDTYAALIKTHSLAGNLERALELSRERHEYLESRWDKADAYYKEAEILASLGEIQEAMVTLGKGLEILPKSSTFLQAKADLLFLLGQMSESLQLYKTVLGMLKDPSQQAKILYTMGRIYHKCGETAKALECYEGELQTIQKAFGENHLDCSRIYHEMVQLHDDACNYELAIQLCRKALEVERLHLSQATGERKTEVSALIKETQHKIGRLYYKKGDFASALRSSFGTDGKDE